MILATDSEIREILREARTIAVVGASAKPWRESNAIMQQLMQAGYTVYPVNPSYTEVLGVKSYPDLRAIPDHVNIVNVFRNPNDVFPIAEAAIAVGADVLWLQSGIIHEEAARLALSAGMKVVMDRCIGVDHRFLIQRRS